MSDTEHRALRVDRAVMRWRARRVRSLGYTASVIGYTGYGSTRWIRILGRVLLTRNTKDTSVDQEGARGWRSFTSVPVEMARVDVVITGESYIVHADSSGVIDTVIEVELEPGWHTITMSAEGSVPTAAHITVIDPAARFGMISDVDDTVMVTALPRPFLAAWHTFVVNEHARTTTPGMPVLYERLAANHPAAPVIYLSTGAWNVAPTLTRFLSRNLYPRGPLLLTDWGPTADRWFRSGREHKQQSLERLAHEFPDIKWLLVGDDGQHDESIYREFATAHPDHVAAVCIRKLTPGEAVLAGSSLREPSAPPTPVPTDSAVPWIYGHDGAALCSRLDELRLIDVERRAPEISG